MDINNNNNNNGKESILFGKSQPSLKTGGKRTPSQWVSALR